MSQRYEGGAITASPISPTTSAANGVWTLEQQFQNSANWPKSSAVAVSRSVRTRASASAYFSRTPASVGNRQTWTWSGWFKRGTLATQQRLFSCTNASSLQTLLAFNATTDVFIFQFANATVLTTTQVFRDPSAWYHVVMAVDTTQATAANRAKLYINGSQVTAFSTATYMAQNATSDFNNTVVHTISSTSTSEYFDGYMTEINFIDGQALDPTYFGFFDSNGIWQPSSYTGAYGTNGYYLNFSDNSAATAATIGKDYSGNGNNWTPNNISVTAGTTYDSMLDVPVNYADGGNGRGNYPVWNVLKRYTNNMGFTNANLTVSDAGTTATGASATMRPPASGKWYWEVTATTISGALGSVLATTEANADTTAFAGNLGYYRSSGTIANLAGTLQTSGATYTSGDVIGVAVDIDNGTVQFYKNGAAQGATPSFTFTAGTILVPAVATDNSAGTKTFDANFGQRPFSATPPSGFVALNTQNLPTPTISNGATVMAATLYTGTNANLTLTNTVNGVSMQPDLVWMKARSSAFSNTLTDSVRGVSKQIFSNLNNAETTETGKGLTAFNSNGFTLGPDLVTTGSTNANGTTYVAWQWQAGQGSSSSNTSGSITSTVSVNATAGFSIVTYTGTGANATVGHGLGVAPKMILVKKRSAIQAWSAYHASLANTQYLVLDSTAAAATLATMWNSASPTSTVISIGTDGNVNASTATYVAYCFAEVAGFSKMGSYTGNGAADGPFVYLGFRPRFMLIKRTDAIENWTIWDSARGTYNANTAELYPNLGNAEANGGGISFMANGMKVSSVPGTNYNTSGATYIFMAFAENPFKTSRAR